jgi:peroxiredoxin
MHLIAALPCCFGSYNSWFLILFRGEISGMALTPSTMKLPLGSAAPDFSLPAPNGKIHCLANFAGRRALLVAFLCNHCPYVKHIAPAFAELAKEYQERGVGVVAVNSNDYEEYPEDSPAKMKEEIAARGYTFPYLVDHSQEVAKAYHAACTPDFYLFDGDLNLVYRGQMDSSRPGSSVQVTGKDLRQAMDAVLAGKPVSGEQRPSMGCNIKWRPGNEPT